MSSIITKYKDDVTIVFGIGVDVLNGARSLKGISLDLKLLAINGIVQAAKIGTSQGQSLITLSGFLSDLPIQIAPELEDLEVLTSELARQLTLCTISMRKLTQYTQTLHNILNRVLSDIKSGYNASDFNLLDLRELNTLHNNPIFAKASEEEKQRFRVIAQMVASNIEEINRMLFSAHSSIAKARKKIMSIKRNGVIANYMGSNILIESSYLSSDQRSFSGLVNNIKSIISTLDNQLEFILDAINRGDSLLSTLLKVRAGRLDS